MNLIEKFIAKMISKKYQSITSVNGLVGFSFKKPYSVIKRRKSIVIFDEVNSHWTLHISSFSSINNIHFKIEEILNTELKENPNSIIREIGKYNAVCSFKRTKNEVLYKYMMGANGIRVLATLLVYEDTGKDNADEIDSEVLSILEGLTIKD